MEKQFEAKLNMLDAVAAHCKKNSTTIGAVKAFENSSKQLADVVKAIREKCVILDTVVTGYAARKAELKGQMIDLAMQHSSALFAMAAKTNNYELKGKVDFPKQG